MPVALRNLILGILRLRCLICLEGKVFRNLFETYRCCSHCGYFFARESGYFLGSVVFGYAATTGVMLSVGIFLVYGVGLGFSRETLAILIVIVVVFPVWFFRYSRMLWMALDVYLNPPVREDFEPRGR